jgi:DNA polymerase-3 subunit alpha (Gram-positive type)
MDITEVNPMSPHYFCKKCGRIEWMKTYDDGFDLPNKTCSCGNEFVKDGHKIPFETFLGFEGDKIPD